MKKTLAMLLALAMVSALCGMLFVSAEETNLAAGKSYTISEQFRMGGKEVGWGWDENAPISYPDGGNELTDGKLPAMVEKQDGSLTSFQTDEWMATSQKTPATADRGYSYIRFDLGQAADLSSAKIVTLKETAPGIQPAYDIQAWISTDGETYELAGSYAPAKEVHEALEDNAIHTLEIALEGTAQYVEFRFVSYGWCFLGEIEVYGTAATADEPVTPPADEHKTYEDYVVGEDGNAVTDVCYGYTWTVNYTNGSLVGEDVTVVTSAEAYAACNPNWAITAILEKQADGTYVAVSDATAGTGTLSPITLGENQVALVVHSSSSKPAEAETYPNWIGKVAAVAINAGDVFTVETDAEGNFVSVHAVDPNASEETPGGPQTGDAGILVFAVLAVVAIAGCSVVVKARG